MKILLWPLLILITYCLNILTSTPLYAVEYTGCLFCHQHPGFVRLQQDKSLKILSIDPDLYQKSTHGHLGCPTCHVAVDTIPHVGASEVDCTSNCHKSEKDRLLLKQTPLKGFHENQQSYITRLPNQTSCKVCHSIYPHSKQPFTRVWLNMHTNFIICETCHYNKTKYNNITYLWQTTNNVKYIGKPFATYYDPNRKHSSLPESSLSRITPVTIDPVDFNTDNTENLTHAEDMQIAESFLALSDSSSITENTGLTLNYFHRNVIKMDLQTVCDTCHKQNGLLDLTALGYTENEARVLSNIQIDKILSHYNTFYIPSVNE